MKRERERIDMALYIERRRERETGNSKVNKYISWTQVYKRNQNAGTFKRRQDSKKRW